MPEDLERLHLAFADTLAATDDFGDWIAADLRFHQAIYFGTRNEFFWPIGRLLEPALLASFRVTSGHRITTSNVCRNIVRFTTPF